MKDLVEKLLAVFLIMSIAKAILQLINRSITTFFLLIFLALVALIWLSS